MNDRATTSLLEFPCDFPIKAFGNGGAGIEVLVAAIVRKHAPDLHDGAIVSRPSSHGRFVAVTVTVRAESQAQLDAIYRELNASPDILMTL